jgi:uncharacterized membrane protein YbhN (UPF0104 family)
MNKNKFLKIYLWVMLILWPIALAFEITGGELSDIIDYLDYILWGTALLGVFGYCYDKKILSNFFWKAYLPFIVIWDFFIGYRYIKNEPEISGAIHICFLIIIALIIILPEYIGLYLYGYKEKE